MKYLAVKLEGWLSKAQAWAETHLLGNLDDCDEEDETDEEDNL